ncbi:hypothetical protein [uncultured Clostridium sp.]|uniref:hypothetical protein n=1 Tax=uncultured Clostridium sp. TaxID=59620 RepID=UPI002616830E|nr:hypothetical protein [uncultured Clostridium sp.]
MLINKRRKVNIIIVGCFLITAGVFALDGNMIASMGTILTGAVFLFAYRLFEKIR